MKKVAGILGILFVIFGLLFAHVPQAVAGGESGEANGELGGKIEGTVLAYGQPASSDNPFYAYAYLLQDSEFVDATGIDEQGGFTFGDGSPLMAGDYRIEISTPEGWRASRTEVVVKDGETSKITINLRELPMEIDIVQRPSSVEPGGMLYFVYRVQNRGTKPIEAQVQIVMTGPTLTTDYSSVVIGAEDFTVHGAITRTKRMAIPLGIPEGRSACFQITAFRLAPSGRVSLFSVLGSESFCISIGNDSFPGGGKR